MIIGVPKERRPGEHRVALVPANVAALIKLGRQVLVEAGAGEAAGHTDAAYREVGASLMDDRAELFAKADIVVQVQAPGQNKANGDEDLAQLREGQVIVGMMDPLAEPEIAQKIAKTGAIGVAMELIPRITRAQSMDVLSSMATIAGYKSVIIAANRNARLFPMFMTAAGTINPARVFVMGAGVAGLQACATARRLGAVVEAYDVRPAAREQIVSVGAKPIEFPELETDAEEQGGYAKAQGDDFIQRQRELMSEVLAQQHVVITTAAVPGKKSPILITAEMVKQMRPGTVIVDLAAEKGGNCELTKLGEEVISDNGVIVLGPENVPASVAYHASQMYGKNVENLLAHLIDDDGNLSLDYDDEIVRDTVIAHNGDVPQARMRELLGLEPLPQPEPEPEPATEESANQES